jgi:dipeptidyl aminopeptidase/acylaminoacyl peptidase
VRRRSCALFVVLVLSLPVLAQGQSPPPASDLILPGDNLIVEGIPPIPRAIADRVAQYTEVRSAGFQSWHPTRREMLVVTRFGDVPQVHHVAMPGGARRQLTFLAERVAGASYRPKAGDSFIYTQDVGGGEWFQIFRYDLETGDRTLLTDGKSRNTGALWREDGRMLAYMSTRRTGRDNDLYVMDPADPATDRQVLQLPGGGWGVSSWSPDGTQLALVEFRSINDTTLWLVDVARGEKTRLTPETPSGTETVAWGRAVFSKDGKGIYLTTDQGSEFQRLTYLDLASRQFTSLTRDIDWDVTGFELSHDGTTIAFVTNEAGVSVLRFLDLASRKEQPGPALPAGLVGGLEWRDGSREVGFTLSHARSAADAYSFDLASGRLERWTESEAGGLNPETFAEPELVRWESFDGRTISGFYYRPAQRFTGKRPVIVNIHGGPEAQARPGFLGRTNYYLNELGVAVIFPNVRGSSGYGKKWIDSDNGPKRLAVITDIEDCAKHIRAAWAQGGKPPKIGVMGGSYGGYSSLMAMTYFAGAYDAGVQQVGISNLMSFLMNTAPYRRILRTSEYGDPVKDRAALIQLSPITHVKKIKAPLLSIQGVNDPRVPVGEALQIYRELEARKIPGGLILFADEGHGTAKRSNQVLALGHTIAFFEKHLMGR